MISSRRTYADLLRKDHRLHRKNLSSLEALAKGAVMMADVERAEYAEKVMEIVLELPEFPSFGKMLDLGGGPGIIGMAIVDAHPKMKGFIFDLPPVVKETKKFIQEYEMEGRMEILGGDFNCDPIGEGYDCVFACNSLQFAQAIDSLVKKVCQLVEAGFEYVCDHDGNKIHYTNKSHIKKDEINQPLFCVRASVKYSC